MAKADDNPWNISVGDLPLQVNVATGEVHRTNLLTSGYYQGSSGQANHDITRQIKGRDGLYYSDIAAAFYNANGSNIYNGQKVNIDTIQYQFQIRNNGNIACNIHYYQLRCRRSRSDTAADTFTEVFNLACTDQGLSTSDHALMLNPYKFDYLTRRYVIVKKVKRLLPGEKWTWNYKTPVKGFWSTTSLIDRQQTTKTTLHGLMIYGDPVHDVNTNQVTTAQAVLDIIVSNYVKVKKQDLPTQTNNTIVSDKLPNLLNAAEFVSAFANAATAFSG